MSGRVNWEGGGEARGREAVGGERREDEEGGGWGEEAGVDGANKEAPVSIRGNGRQSDAVTAPAINIL